MIDNIIESLQEENKQLKAELAAYKKANVSLSHNVATMGKEIDRLLGLLQSLNYPGVTP